MPREDANDAAQPRNIYMAVGPAPALMITEGLLMYLPAPTVEARIGIAASDPSAAEEPEDLLRMADRRLYEAKTAGRNRVV